jgi:hypothetical protein
MLSNRLFVMYVSNLKYIFKVYFFLLYKVFLQGNNNLYNQKRRKNMGYIIFVELIIALYCFVIFYKRQQDKQSGILSIEEYEHLIVFRDDVIRHDNPGETILQIATRVQNGENVKIENPEICNVILKIIDKNRNCDVQLIGEENLGQIK